MIKLLLSLVADFFTALALGFFIWWLADGIGAPYDPTYIESATLALILVIVKDWLQINTWVGKVINEG